MATYERLAEDIAVLDGPLGGSQWAISQDYLSKYDTSLPWGKYDYPTDDIIIRLKMDEGQGNKVYNSITSGPQFTFNIFNIDTKSFWQLDSVTGRRSLLFTHGGDNHNE